MHRFTDHASTSTPPLHAADQLHARLLYTISHSCYDEEVANFVTVQSCKGGERARKYGAQLAIHTRSSIHHPLTLSMAANGAKLVHSRDAQCKSAAILVPSLVLKQVPLGTRMVCGWRLETRKTRDVSCSLALNLQFIQTSVYNVYNLSSHTFKVFWVPGDLAGMRCGTT